MKKLDERFRVYLQGMACDPVAEAAFGNATIRGLTKRGFPGLLKELAASSRKATLNGEETFAVEVKDEHVHRYFEKITRGLYYLHLKKPFAGEVFSVCSHLSKPGIDFREFILTYKSMEQDFVKGFTTDDRVFKYSYASRTESGRELYALNATFYSNVTVFGYGIGDVR